MSTTVQSSVANRRSAKRLTARTSVTIEVRKGALGLGANVASQFLDISEGGACVIVKNPLAVGSEVEVTLTGNGVGKPIKRVAAVRWAVMLESGQHAVGLNFDKRIPYQDVSAYSRPIGSESIRK